MDSVILDTPLYRLQQQVATIQLRHFQKQREENSRVSWQTRILASYISMGYMMDEKSVNEPLNQSKFIAIDEVERLLLKEEDAKPQVYENTPGSFERLTAGALF